MLKSGVEITERRGLKKRTDAEGRIISYKPWLGDAFSFMYDLIIENCFCSFPVPELNSAERTIRGTLRSRDELRGLFPENGFQFITIPEDNGAILYFTAEAGGSQP